MFNFVTNTLASVAKEVVSELQQFDRTSSSSNNSLLLVRKNACYFDRLVLCGLPTTSIEANADLHPARSMIPFASPEALRLQLYQVRCLQLKPSFSL
jgi:hypothetical protein